MHYAKFFLEGIDFVMRFQNVCVLAITALNCSKCLKCLQDKLVWQPMSRL